jgi:omega-6 fatty acid desaturase (delta-12 desaturase)
MLPAFLSNCLFIPSFQLCCTAPLISNLALQYLFLSMYSRFLMLCSHTRYAAYWVCQGCILTGVWVIAHECGHGGFSPSDLVNDIVGSICHSFLLVPYWSWKFSHAKVPFFFFCSSFQKC